MLLKGHNTTISIAHRLSTIKRSDSIIVLSPDGKVAQQGSYADLSRDPNGAFTKLMEWQMSGGETKGEPQVGNHVEQESKETLGGFEDVVEGLSEESEAEEDGEALKENRGDEAGPQTVLDKSLGDKK